MYYVIYNMNIIYACFYVSYIILNWIWIYLPGCGNSSSKGDILPSGDENVFWLERFCSYHCLPANRKCLIKCWWKYNRREKVSKSTLRSQHYQENSVPEKKILKAQHQPDICFQPLSDLNAFFILSRVQVTLQSRWVIIQLRTTTYSVWIFPSLNQTLPWLSALDHNDHHNQRDHHDQNDACALHQK